MRNVFARARRSAPCLVALEDLDALIEDENRAFLLNELDGFADNEGVVVIASTNHPEKLDPAILDRPSRFDRKYHFGLPGLRERLAYINHWNQRLQFELRLTEAEEAAIAEYALDGVQLVDDERQVRACHYTADRQERRARSFTLD